MSEQSTERELVRPKNAAEFAAGVGINDDEEWVKRRLDEMERSQRRRRPGRIERAILEEMIAAGGRSDIINNHGPSTGAAIERLEAKGWLLNEGNAWAVSEAGRKVMTDGK